MGKFKDLTGQRFGKLVVIERDLGHNRPYWKCKCDCGNFKVVRSDSLTRGVTKSCGCSTNAARIVGQRFGMLTVIKQIDKGKKNSRWLCQCDCGNSVIKNYTDLKKSPNPNCGCNPNRSYEDLTGQKFNMLTVIDRNLDNGYKGKVKWNCVCDCGNKTVVEGYNLKSGMVKSCGCLQSYIEKRVAEELTKAKIVYKKQFSFENLFFKNKKHPLRFDFAVFNNNELICLIECQGRQHWDQESQFYTEEGIERDTMKKQYCEKNNIPLIYFYKDENNILNGIQTIKMLLKNKNN